MVPPVGGTEAGGGIILQINVVVCAFLAALVLLSAWWVVTLRNLFRAALSLGLVLLGVAGLFLVLEAEFLAFVQVLVYVGAILTLVIFAIMLTARLQLPEAPPPPPARPALDPGRARQPLPALLTSVSLFGILALTTQSLVWPAIPLEQAVALSALGQQLVTTLVLPFELISLVFVAAMVGAIAIAVGRSPRA